MVGILTDSLVGVNVGRSVFVFLGEAVSLSLGYCSIGDRVSKYESGGKSLASSSSKGIPKYS